MVNNYQQRKGLLNEVVIESFVEIFFEGMMRR